MDYFSLLTGLIGGLAMFLYGMNVMSGALTKAAGGRLEQMLTKITSNRWVAYFFGIVITALVQSSSASTVMVVGMVNAGLMTLAEAVNLILGANLGTTFTAWLLSLNAISSENFFLNLLRPVSFTPFLALAGVVLYLFSKSDKRQYIGQVMLGFSVLMFGMNMMSTAVSPLKDVPAFTAFLTRFSNPVLGFLLGLLFTMVIQSSAGTIGVVQALAMSVGLTYAVAIPVVIGSEVGTCITAILSSIGASKNAKRTAAMHLSYNIIKAVSFMIIFYTLNAFLHFALLEKNAGMAGIALVHTLVNLVATPLMVPFSGLLVRLAYRVIPVTPDEEQPSKRKILALDDRFLSNTAFAVQQARLAALDMASMAQDCFLRAASLLNSYDDAAVQETKDLEKQIDSYEDQLGTYLVKLNSHHLLPADSHEVSILMHCINDFERISDHALNIMETYEEMHEKSHTFSDKARAELTVITDAVTEALSMAVEVFRTGDRVLASRIEPLEEVIDDLQEEIKKRHLQRVRKGKCSIDVGFDLSDLGMNLERIADHCSNVAVCVLQVDDNVFDTHEYLESVRGQNDAVFNEAQSQFAARFSLPEKKKDKEADADTDAEKAEKKRLKKEKKALKKEQKAKKKLDES
ncbi:MAG: Na/Pi cotransporter family protein [Lachnospiraceae bacterium]|nr:Na/Pi cotransporter family protein [Lachnospiraceae bacterium]